MTILAIDIGNTTTTLGVCRGKRVFDRTEVPTTQPQRHYQAALEKIVRKNAKVCDAVVVTSVVPKALRHAESAARRAGAVKVLVVGRDLKVPLINRYTDPRQVGQDRLVSAYAAARLYGTPAIIVDLGTAITFDVVSAKDEYLGGIITPGIRLSTEALYEQTALLPRARIQRPAQLIGRDTEGSIMSGIFYGYGEMIGGVIRLLRRRIKGRPKVIVTGGFTGLMKSYVSGAVHRVDNDLVLKGMALLVKPQK